MEIQSAQAKWNPFIKTVLLKWILTLSLGLGSCTWRTVSTWYTPYVNKWYEFLINGDFLSRQAASCPYLTFNLQVWPLLLRLARDTCLVQDLPSLNWRFCGRLLKTNMIDEEISVWTRCIMFNMHSQNYNLKNIEWTSRGLFV